MDFFELKTPEWAKQEINFGRMKGFTSIKPIWRISILNKYFGKIGEGWNYNIEKEEIQEFNDGQKLYTVIINLEFISSNNIYTIKGAGSSFISRLEKKGLYVNEEYCKMAITDAIGNATKYLGIGADVYGYQNNNKIKDDKYTIVSDEAKNNDDINIYNIDYNNIINKKEISESSVSKIVNFCNKIESGNYVDKIKFLVIKYMKFDIVKYYNVFTIVYKITETCKNKTKMTYDILYVIILSIFYDLISSLELSEIERNKILEYLKNIEQSKLMVLYKIIHIKVFMPKTNILETINEYIK